jgi:hypothetical protein
MWSFLAFLGGAAMGMIAAASLYQHVWGHVVWNHLLSMYQEQLHMAQNGSARRILNTSSG